MKKFEFYTKNALKTFSQMEMRILPGNIAFFSVLALIPLISMVAAMTSYFGIDMGNIISFIKKIIPSEVSKLIIEAISGKGFDTSIGAFNIFVFFAASNGTYAIINASNTLYKVKERDFLKDRIKSIILLLILLTLIIFLLLVPLFGGKILDLFKNKTIVIELRWIYQILKWPITVFMIYMNLKLIYTIAPSKKIKSNTTTYGAIFTTIIWTIATAIFSYYLKYFANYNVIYGNLSSIIILMIWIYIISYVFVLGLAINVTNCNEN